MMLTAKENYLELVNGGKPERFVNQFEFLDINQDEPFRNMNPRIRGKDTKDPWGVTIRWKAEDFAGMPHITEETKVCPDITKWRDTVKAPDLNLPDEAWVPAVEAAKLVDRKEKFVACSANAGFFERLHFLMGFEDTLMNFILEPEAMHELLDYILGWRMEYFRHLIERLQLEAVVSHDDWGAKDRMFMSRETWLEFFKPRYAKLYGYIKSRGVHIIHHADSYCAPLIHDMVEIGIETWQGVLPTNNIPVIQQELKGKLVLMGGLDAGAIDRPGWTEDLVREEVQRACREYGPDGGFIPCITYGSGESIFGGVYETISDEISKQSAKYFE